MKCAKCGMEILPSAGTCSRCGEAVSQEFNYTNMEKELLHTVWEEETINGISGSAMLYQQQVKPQTIMKMENQKGMRTIEKHNRYEEMDEMDAYEEEEEPKKQPIKLVVSLLASAAVFGGLAFFLHNFNTDYQYDKTETEYQNCLSMMAKEDYPGALDSVSLLLDGKPDDLAYLALKNTICEKNGDSKQQKKTLKQIISLDTDNFPAYAKLLELYLEEENQEGIEKLAADAPTSAIASMLSEYLVDTPYLVLTPGVYDAIQTLEITSENGNSIYYTLDGSSPQEHGSLYAAPIQLEQDYIYSVRAVCKNERGAYGEEASGDYQIGINAVNHVSGAENMAGMDSGMGSGTENTASASVNLTLDEPQVYPQSGAYTTQQRITIDVPIGYQAYYSWSLGDALTPQNGTLYTGGITMPEGDSILSVIITDGNGGSTAVKQVSYTYQP